MKAVFVIFTTISNNYFIKFILTRMSRTALGTKNHIKNYNIKSPVFLSFSFSFALSSLVPKCRNVLSFSAFKYTQFTRVLSFSLSDSLIRMVAGQSGSHRNSRTIQCCAVGNTDIVWHYVWKNIESRQRCVKTLFGDTVNSSFSQICPQSIEVRCV